MPLQISKTLIKKLPQAEQADAEQKLRDKSADRCFLCDHPLLEASNIIVADHDIPEANGGKTELANLNLAHKACNEFKRNHPTISVRPYLRLTALIRNTSERVSYDVAASLLGYTASPSLLRLNSTDVVIELPGQSPITVPILSELVAGRRVTFCFAALPPTAIFNDKECQPRTIKAKHLWTIYTDLAINPVHEPPGIRLSGTPPEVNLVMFDGQHKTIAAWLAGRTSIVAKIYLDLDIEQTRVLVNSVQSRIKKLPLSPFELASKMSDEWRDRVAQYEEEAGEKASEAGFFDWIGKDERARAKAAFQEALIQTVIELEPAIMKYVVLQGEKMAEGKITESTLRNKVLRTLLSTEPLSAPFGESQQQRDREAANITTVLNKFVAAAFEPADGSQLTGAEQERLRRLCYQASIQYVAKLLREAYEHRVTDGGFLERDPDEASWKKIGEDIVRIARHPVWTVDLTRSEKTKAVHAAMTNNQNVDTAFRAVMLRKGYVCGVDDLEGDVFA